MDLGLGFDRLWAGGSVAPSVKLAEVAGRTHKSCYRIELQELCSVQHSQMYRGRRAVTLPHADRTLLYVPFNAAHRPRIVPAQQPGMREQRCSLHS